MITNLLFRYDPVTLMQTSMLNMHNVFLFMSEPAQENNGCTDLSSNRLHRVAYRFGCVLQLKWTQSQEQITFTTLLGKYKEFEGTSSSSYQYLATCWQGLKCWRLRLFYRRTIFVTLPGLPVLHKTALLGPISDIYLILLLEVPHIHWFMPGSKVYCYCNVKNLKIGVNFRFFSKFHTPFWHRSEKV